jgi:hypothetical protein
LGEIIKESKKEAPSFEGAIARDGEQNVLKLGSGEAMEKVHDSGRRQRVIAS